MNRNLKIALLVVGGLVVFVGATVALVSKLTSGLTESADGFFLAVRDHDLARARGYLSEEFRARTSEADLAAFLAGSTLDRFREAKWASRSITNDRGRLRGSVKTDTGGVVPLELDLVKENGAWRIYAVRRPQAGLEE